MRETKSRPVDVWARVDDGWTPRDVMRFLRRRWKWIAGGCAACMLLAALYWLVSTPRYVATGEIEIQKQQPNPVGLASMENGGSEASSDALDYDVTLQTQVNILRSDTLALSVIQQLGLEKSRQFFGGKPYLFQRGFAFWRQPLEPLSIPLEDAPNRRYAALKIFRSNLRVTPVSGTRLIRISYKDANPQQAAAVVNALVQSLEEYSYQAHYTSTEQTEKWLSGQLPALKKQTEALQKKAIALQRATGEFGDNESGNIMLSRLKALNQTLAMDEADRILKGAIYKTAMSGNSALISGLAGNAARSTGVQNSLELIQDLRNNEAVVNAKIAQDSKRYGARFPEMAELESERASLKQSIAKEIKRLGERAHTDYLIAQRTEAGARAALVSQEQHVNALNNKAVAYAVAKQRADDSSKLYGSLLGKLQEAGVLAGLNATSMRVVNPARAPSLDHPASPNLPKDEAIGLAGGLVFGFGAALLLEMTDERLHGKADVEELLEQRVLAAIPEVGTRRWMYAWGVKRGAVLMPAEVRARLNEPFRLLRTAMQARDCARRAQVILVTSPVGGEGKSTIAAQLASAFAWQKSRVLLVEADFRSASSSGSEEPDSQGLSGVLHGKHEAGGSNGIQHDEKIPGLAILPRGSVPEFPAELLGAERMQDLMVAWRREYDYIVIDGPACLPVADAAVLAQQADAALLVLRERMTLRGDALHALDLMNLQMPEGAKVGVVLNGAAKRKGEPVYAMAS